MPVRLRVFSLNCWGIRYLSKHCTERYAMIGDLLSKEQHDVVLLQEVWSEKDFHFLKTKLGSTHPYSHYFKSGFIGSGLAVFSRHLIHDVFLYKYSLNGYPYMGSGHMVPTDKPAAAFAMFTRFIKKQPY